MRGRRRRERAVPGRARGRAGAGDYAGAGLHRSEVPRARTAPPASRQDRGFRRKVWSNAMKFTRYLLILLAAFALLGAPPQKKASPQADTKSGSVKPALLDINSATEAEL